MMGEGENWQNGGLLTRWATSLLVRVRLFIGQ